MGTFIWKISNLNTTGVIVSSPEFYVPSIRESGWKLRLKIPSEGSEEITIDLCNIYFNEDDGDADKYCHYGCEVSILARNPQMSFTHFQRRSELLHNWHCVMGARSFPSWLTIALSENDYLLHGVLTIQCKLWNVNKDNLEACPTEAPPLIPMFHHAITKLGVRKFSTDWLLNFSDLKKGNVQTKQFILDGRRELPALDVETFTKRPHKLGLVFNFCSEFVHDIVITCKISLLDVSERVKIWKECSLHLKSKVRVPHFISIDTISSNKSEYVKDNQIKLVFDFMFRTDEYSAIESISKFPPQIEPNLEPLNTRNLFTTQRNSDVGVDATTSIDMETNLPTKVLKENLLNMYVSNSWSDVVLEAEGKSFPCHKCILCTRSPVFCTLLSESTTHETNLKASTLGSMLQFMYTGDIGVPLDFQSALELYEAATKYQVMSLKDVSSWYLENNMTVQNVHEVLIVASKSQDMELKKRTDNFILDKSRKDCRFLRTSKWEEDLVKNYPKSFGDTLYKLLLDVMQDEDLGILNTIDQWMDDYDTEGSIVKHSSDLFSIFKSSLFSDFKLCTNGKAFAVHKDILWARSPVFKAMFSSNLKESSLDVSNVDEQTMERMLSFMYSDKIEVVPELEELNRLYYLADKYQIWSLKDWCTESFVGALSTKNACEGLRLAGQHEDLKLKNAVLDFFVRNAERIFFSSDSGWEKFMQSEVDLSNEVAFQVMSKKMNIISQADRSISPESDRAYIFQDDLLALYEEKFLTDCVLRVNDKSFEVHKNILCARSPVFHAMFTGNLEEATTNILDIPDIDEVTVDLMLRYLYTGTFSEDETVDLYSLYYAADKYQIDSLADWCSDLLGERIDICNVCETLLFAYKHANKRLETVAREYIVDYYEEIFNTDLWEDFMLTEPEVACRTMYFVYTKNVMYVIK